MYESPELLRVLVSERQQELWRAMRAGDQLSDRMVAWLGRRLHRHPEQVVRKPAGDQRLAA